MARTDLSLGNLYRAVSGSVRTGQVSLGGLAGASAGSNANMLGFATDAVSVTPPTYTYIVESTTENAQFSFTSTGSLFYSKVQQQLANFTCSFNNANFSTGSNTFSTGPTVIPITPASIAQSTYSEASAVLTMGYADGYNINATNYGSAGKQTKTLYAVDVYNTINQPDFCLLFGTKITKADGTEINVEDLVVGDQIKAWMPTDLPDENMDPSSPEVDWTLYMRENVSGNAQNVTVADLVFNFASGYYDINNGFIKATGTHPVYAWDSEIEKYRFKNIQNILIGDLILTYDEIGGISEVEVYDIGIVNSDVEIVTINVENADVYLANKIISHNKGTTSQPFIPSTGLRMYMDQYKTVSYNSGSATADWLDLSGWNTGVRPAGVTNAAGITGDNPTSTNGATKKASYVTFNGTNQFFYKDKTTNINGGYSQFNVNTGTIHVWVRPTAASIGAASRFIFDYAGYYGLAIESSDSSAYNRIKFYGSSLGNSAQLTTSLAVGTNYLISATFQPSGTVTVYVDGTSIGTFTAAAFTAPASTDFLTIGCNSARTSFWNGGIQAVLFYNVLQSSTDVTQIYNHFSTTLK
jgi:hypothetical protein